MSSARQPPASATATGHTAETHAAVYLASHGYKILDRNWRNRWCELDIVAQQGSGPTATVHFIEVKYRRRPDFGLPIEYISHDKIQRLTRAALAWNQTHHYLGPYQIDIVSVSGSLDRPQIEYLANAIYS